MTAGPVCGLCLRPFEGSDDGALAALADALLAAGVRLTPSELRVLLTLRIAKGRTVSKSAMYDTLWGHDAGGGPDDPRKDLDQLVCKIRRKLAAPEVAAPVAAWWIETVWGAGWRFIEPDALLSHLAQIRDYGARSVVYSGGGEPLFHKQITEILERTYHLGFQVGMLTNGVRFIREPTLRELVFGRNNTLTVASRTTTAR